MSPCKAGQLRTYALGEQQITSGLFVRRAGPRQFGDVCGLPDVMRSCPEQHRVAVELQSRVPLCYPVDELVCDIVDGSQVGRQARRGIKIP
jgi:hypothetical protein